jgi:hypothetical protein
MSGLRRNAKNTFGKVEKLMLDNPQKTIEFFGRGFAHYCRAGVCRQNSDNRYYWVNLTLDNHLEFRINKFQSAEQYMALIHLEEKWVKTIVEGIDNGWEYETIGKKLAEQLEKAWG